ncbi:MAG: eight transrane protein EpsH [Candidatus Solibacter sp.]|nr:eight transrane protein EpsH [Candidatus Solibacter sp.]
MRAYTEDSDMNRKSQAAIVLAAISLLVCYAGVLRGMAFQWWTDEDMGHGFLVPLVILWIVWRERNLWRKVPAQPSMWGFLWIAAGAGLQVAGAIGVGLFAGAVGFLCSALGVVICFGGFARARAWFFPILLSLFMLPKLAIVYNQVTLPLQLLATRQAAAILWAVGVTAIREGNVLQVGAHRVAVVEACNGLRYLLPLGFAAVVFAYLADDRPWMRAALLIAAIPVAMLANAVRVAASAYVPALSEGAFHTIAGWLLFAGAMAAIFLIHVLLTKLRRRRHA